jgi:hypothetical protein
MHPQKGQGALTVTLVGRSCFSYNALVSPENGLKILHNRMVKFDFGYYFLYGFRVVPFK